MWSYLSVSSSRSLPGAPTSLLCCQALKTDTRPTHKPSFQCRALIVVPRPTITQCVRRTGLLLPRLCTSPLTATSKRSLAGLLVVSCRVRVLLCDYFVVLRERRVRRRVRRPPVPRALSWLSFASCTRRASSTCGGASARTTAIACFLRVFLGFAAASFSIALRFFSAALANMCGIVCCQDYFRARAERMYRNAALARVRKSVGAEAKNTAKPRFGAMDMP